MYKNNEGYFDPTAGIAMGQIMKEYKKERREIWQRQIELKERKKVYIVSRYAGDIENNVTSAIRYCRFAIEKKKMPIAAHLLYPQIVDDGNPGEREIGMMYGLALLAICDEVWCFGKELSQGMELEINEAKRLGNPIKYFNEEAVIC